MGAVAQAPRPHAPGLRYAQERAIQLALGFSAALTLQAKPELRNSSLLHGWAPSGIKQLAITYLALKKSYGGREKSVCHPEQARSCATVVFGMVGLHQSILLLNLALQNHAKIRTEPLTFRCDLKGQHARQLRPGAVLLISTAEHMPSTLALHWESVLLFSAESTTCMTCVSPLRHQCFRHCCHLLWSVPALP